ncbi:type II secretion system protein GspG [Acinetobacter calcoaceticus]|uniref:Type II secretion system core protein G n=1 Tax=Acinetobacter oleivorans TaxID=1148157 RepID=A0A0B2UGC4_9GAMM|nr:type II secretion system major pseudopilin GspG [Acinetobacter calcoaceticus]KHN68413.1 general secretion pathway protein GspG [Acinetobacter oleivorans]KUM12845.1 type II secretion system protein GspG [Acinetobacter calcoaceticus]
MKVKNIQSETAMEQLSQSAVSNQFEPTCHSEHSFPSDVCSSSIAFGLAARSSRARMKRVSGFTLIEVMVVIVILGVLAALIVPNVMGRSEKAKIDTTQITLKGVAGALDQYKLDNGHFPSMQEGGLDALVNQPATAKNWMPGGYVKGGYPKDSWKNDVQYVIPGADGRAFDLYSFGADGKEGGEGNDADIYYQP